MRKGFSLQWKLTLMTAFLVIIACLSLSYFIGKSAVFYMDNIEDSITTIFPQELFSDNSSGNVEVYIDTTQMISDMVRDTQVEFWGKSLLITLVITLISSCLIYFIVGCTLSPLQKFSRQIQEIQAKNLQKPIELKGNAIEIVHLTETFNGMLQRLNNAFLIQKQFSANAAHELLHLRLYKQD